MRVACPRFSLDWMDVFTALLMSVAMPADLFTRVSAQVMSLRAPGMDPASVCATDESSLVPPPSTSPLSTFVSKMESSESSSTDPSTSPHMAAKALRVLLVDADPEYLAANRQRLELDGHEVHTATDGASALELAAGWAPDLLVLAMVLPRIDGLAVLETLRTQEGTQALPVIVLSSNTERRLVRRSRELRAVDYLSKQSKSTDPAMLSTAIFAWLRSRPVPPDV